MNTLMVLSVILTLASIGAVIYYFALLKTEKEKGVRDVWVINSMTQYTKGKSAIGKLKEIYEKDGWSAVVFYPRDRNLKKLEKEKKKIEPEVIFLPNNNLNWINKGAWSGDCGVLELLPIRDDDMPEGLKNSAFGLGAMFKSETKETERFENRIRTERDKNIEEMVMDVTGLRLVKAREKFLIEGIVKEPESKPPTKK